MVYLHWMILAVYVVVIVATMTAVLMDNRQPVKTMAWLMVLVFLPVVGIVLYFFFGQNIRKERMISSPSAPCSNLPNSRTSIFPKTSFR